MVALVGFVLLGFCAYYYRKKVFVSFLFAAYALSFLCTVLMYFLGFYESVTLEWLPLFYLLIVFGVVFPSFSVVSERIVVDDIGRLKIIGDIFLLFGLMSVFFYGYHAFLILMNENLGNIRLQSGTFVKGSIINTLLSVFSTLYFVPMLMFFLFLKKNIYRLYRTLLLFSTISFPLLCLSYAGRDGLIFWFLNFVVLFVFFQKDLTDDLKKIILKFVKVSLALVVIILLFITVKRFGRGVEGLCSFLDYAGQQFFHFSNTFYCNRDLFGVSSHVFAGWEGLLNRFFAGEQLASQTGAPIMVSGVNEYNVFSFFVSSFTRDYGKILGLFVLILFAVIVRYFTKKINKRGNCFDLIILFVLFQIPMNGVFYYRQGIGNGDVIYTLFILFIAIYRRFNIN